MSIRKMIRQDKKLNSLFVNNKKHLTKLYESQISKNAAFATNLQNMDKLLNQMEDVG